MKSQYDICRMDRFAPLFLPSKANKERNVFKISREQISAAVS
jgi:hypothetical protein